MRDREADATHASGAAPRPVLPAERILALDVFRGFAMFGVLVAYCAWSLGTRPAETWTPLDYALAGFIEVAVDGKFYTILAFLFGLGFNLQLSHAGEAQDEAARLYRRRLLVLAGIGLAHALLLRNGDILLPYALTGFLLIPFRRASDRALLAAACLTLLVPLGARLLWQASGLPMPERPGVVAGGYLAENFAWVRYWYATAILNWPLNLTLFLFGLYAGRRGLVTRLAERRMATWAILIGGLAAATLLLLLRVSLAAGFPEEPSVFQREALSLLFSFQAWGLAAAYMAALLLVQRSAAGARALRPLAVVGRMALTNYLMQAALIVPVCLAFGLFDRFTPTSSLLLALAFFLFVQLPFSLLWLRRFDFGPAEYLWRMLTYRGAFPIRARQELRPL